MSQLAPALAGDACGGDGSWLPLTEYSVKSGVSLSTIRRKIKTNSIPFRLEKGKYLIRFSDGTDSLSTPTLPISAPVALFIPEEKPKRAAPTPPPTVTQSLSEERWAVPLIERSVKLVSDAFEKTLHEKDERIRLLEKRSRELEERLNELKLLVRVLEEKYEVRY
jgi:hypothetical protein